MLFSGGLDSTTCLAWTVRQGWQPVCLTVDYGQRHRVEIDRAKAIAATFPQARHHVVSVDLRQLGGSSLTSASPVAKDRSLDAIGQGIPETYVPARNLVMLSLASAVAEVSGAQHLVVGVNAVDYSGYPDCRPEFIAAFERAANLGTAAGVGGRRIKVHAPLSGLSKAEIVRLGVSLGVHYELTHSCYDPAPDGAACGRCDSCLLRKKGFFEAGVPDPTRYVADNIAVAPSRGP